MIDVEWVDYCEYICELLYMFYVNEIDYVYDLYDELGWIDDVLFYMCYNVNKVLVNLGY